jgi:hypothetical protein
LNPFSKLDFTRNGFSGAIIGRKEILDGTWKLPEAQLLS